MVKLHFDSNNWHRRSSAIARMFEVVTDMSSGVDRARTLPIQACQGAACTMAHFEVATERDCHISVLIALHKILRVCQCKGVGMELGYLAAFCSC